MKFKKEDISLIVGCISGYSVANAIRKGFKMTGHVGPIQGLGRVVTEVSVGVLTGSFVSLFVDRVWDVGKRVFNEYTDRKSKGTGSSDHDPESGFISESEFYKLQEEIADLDKVIDITIEDLLYFTDDQVLLSSNDQQCVWPDFIKMIDDEMYDTCDTWTSFEELDLYYFDAKQRICYDIMIVLGSGEEYLRDKKKKGTNQNDGEQPKNS